MRRRVVLGTLIAVVCASVRLQAAMEVGAVGGAGHEDRRARRVAELIRERLEDGGPGLAVAVVRAGRVAHARGYGLARGPAGGARESIEPGTVFDTASLAKQFTAVAILKLVESGRVSLDDPVTRWLAELTRRDARASSRPVRVRDLLGMTSGLPDFHWTGRDFDAAPERVTNQDVVAFVAARGPDAAPGGYYEYSNADYVLLARIVEIVSGLPFADYLERELFAPLGMTRTRQADHRRGAPAGAAVGHERSGDGWRALSAPLSVTGAFHVYSTVEDLARWDLALRRGQVLRKPELMELAYRSGRLDGSRQRTEYGFGWNLQTHRGRRLAWHTGRWPGFRAYMGRYLDDDLTVIVLSNDHKMDCGILGGLIAEAYLDRG